MAVRWVTMAVLLGSAPAAGAQVNAEVLRPRPYQEGWSGGVDASFALLRGNVELFDLGAASRLQYQTLHPEQAEGALPWTHHRVFGTISGRFTEAASRLLASRGFAHVRWTAMWHRNVGSDVFAQGQFDELQRLQVRVIGGIGVRVEIVHEHAFTLAFGSAPMLEYDRIQPVPDSTEPRDVLDVRWSSYLTARLALFENALLVQNTIYVQPRVDRPEDLRLLEELEVLTRIDPVLSFGATLGVLFDSEPPQGVRRTDIRVASTLRAGF